MEPSGFEAGLQVPQVEGDVVGDEDRITEKGVQVFRQRREFRSVRHHAVVDAGQPRDAEGDGTGRPDEPHPAVEFPPAIVQDGRDLGDVVSRRGATIGLDVDDDELGRRFGHGAKDGIWSTVDVRC